MAGKAEGKGQRRMECGGAQLGVQWERSSGKAWVGGAVHVLVDVVHVGWYIPVLVVVEKRLSRNGVRVVVMKRRAAVGKRARGFEVFELAMGVRSRKGW